MPDSIAAVLTKLGNQPDRFEKLRNLLDNDQRRAEYADYAEELVKHESDRFAGKMLDRSKFYAELVEREGGRLKGKGQVEAVKALDTNIPDILGSLETALDHKDTELLLRFARYVGIYLDTVSRWQEALDWYERLVKSADQAASRELQIQTRLGYGTALWRLGQYCKAEYTLIEVKCLAEEEGDIESTASALNRLGIVEYYQGRLDEAKEHYQECLAIRREIGDHHGIAGSLNNLGNVAEMQGRYDDAEKFYNQALVIKREIGNWPSVCSTFVAMGNLLAGLDHMEQAVTLLYGAEHHAEQIGHVFSSMVQARLEDGFKKVQLKKETVGLAQLKAQAEAMSLEELVEYALNALEEIKLDAVVTVAK